MAFLDAWNRIISGEAGNLSLLIPFPWKCLFLYRSTQGGWSPRAPYRAAGVLMGQARWWSTTGQCC